MTPAPSRSPRARGAVLLAVAVGVILIATLTPDKEASGESFHWALSFDRQNLTESALNAVLFAPLGIALATIRLSWYRALFSAVALSSAIEVIQLFWIPGRFGELQDVISNSVGALIGWALVAALQSR